MTHLGLLTLLHELPGSVALHDLVAEAGDVEHHTATHQYYHETGNSLPDGVPLLGLLQQVDVLGQLQVDPGHELPVLLSPEIEYLNI